MRFLRASGLPLPVRPILGPRRTTSSGGKPIVRGFAIFFRILPMLGRMSTVAGKRIRVDAEPDRVGELSRWQSETGRFACKPLTLVILAGRSSWPTSGEWQTTSTTMRRDMHRRAAQRRGAAARHRNLRPLRPPDEFALHRAQWRLSGLLLPGLIATSGPRIMSGSSGIASRHPRRARSPRVPSPRIRLRSQSPRWGSWRKRVGNSNGNGPCDENGRVTRPSGRAANMTPSSPKTGLWRARLNEPGRTSCAPSKPSNRNMHAGIGRTNRHARGRTCGAAAARRKPTADLARQYDVGGRPKAYSAFYRAGG